MKTRNLAVPATAVLLVALSWSLSADAIPAFARQTGMSCGQCHNAWPQLTAQGRHFKENGYRLPGQENVDVPLMDAIKSMPVAASVVSRPYDKKEDRDGKLRALHEFEVWLAGPLGRRFSTWAEFEAEDEEGFDNILATGNVSYRVNEQLNVRAGYSNIFFDDPYGFLSAHFNMTGPARPQIIDSAFGGGEGRLRDPRQMVSISGRLLDRKIFYTVAYADDTRDVEGEDPRTFMGRLAYDISDDVHIGGFYIDGSRGSGSEPESLGIVGGLPAVIPASVVPGTDFERFGLDGHVDYKDLRIFAAYVRSQDKIKDGRPDEDNDFASVQAFYSIKDGNANPRWVPLVRYDGYERNDGREDFADLTAQLTYYLMPNVKIFGQYTAQLKTPSGVDKVNRFTLQLQAAF